MFAVFTSIPIIDIAEASDPVIKPKVLKELRYALLDVGFLYIRNHGVPPNVVHDLVKALPVIFALTKDEKTEMGLHHSPHFLGYSGMGEERTAGTIDGKEQFEFATCLADTWIEGHPLADRLKGPNQVSHVFNHPQSPL